MRGLFTKDYWIIKRSGLFDPVYYLKQHSDVRLADVDPLEHFVLHGWKEGRKPNEWFDVKDYSSLNQINSINPFAHFIKFLEGKFLQTSFKIAFIVGCARSGTSILGELIASHPKVKYIFEAHHIWEMAGYGPDGSHRLTENCATPEIIYKIRMWFLKQYEENKYIIEKNPRNVLRISFIKKIFPEAKIIHIIRDGRDVACSMVPGIGGDRWEHLKPPGWKYLKLNYTGPLRCALAWKEIMEIALNDLRSIDHLQIKYEDLVLKPNQIIKRIFKYLELDEDKNVYNFAKKIQNDTKGSYHARHQVFWYRDNHKFRIGRWKENLTPEEATTIEEYLAPLLKKLGYI